MLLGAKTLVSMGRVIMLLRLVEATTGRQSMKRNETLVPTSEPM